MRFTAAACRTTALQIPMIFASGSGLLSLAAMLLISAAFVRKVPERNSCHTLAVGLGISLALPLDPVAEVIPSQCIRLADQRCNMQSKFQRRWESSSRL
jgi:hypothetical protein